MKKKGVFCEFWEVKKIVFSLNFFFERCKVGGFVLKNLEKYYRVKSSNRFFIKFENFKCICFFSVNMIDLYFI